MRSVTYTVQILTRYVKNKLQMNTKIMLSIIHSKRMLSHQNLDLHFHHSYNNENIIFLETK